MPSFTQCDTTRRRILQTSALLAASGAVPTTRAAATTRADAAITFEDQESDGDSVVIAAASTAVDARLLVVAGTSTVFRSLRLDAGTEFTDRTVELSTPIRGSQQVRAELRTVDGTDELLARDRALVAVDESLANARSTIRLPDGQAEIVDPNPDAGFSHPYVLYRPDTAAETARPLFVLPHNDRPASTRAELVDQLRGAVNRPQFRLADTLGFPGLIPGFPRPPDDGGDLIQSLALPTFGSDPPFDRLATDDFPADSLRRVDVQLVNMIDDARNRLSADGYTVADRVHMTGFSAAAQFSARFALLYPDRVDAIAVGGNGAYPLPRESLDGTRLPYPLGVADYETITGREFDREAWRSIRQYIYVGQQDQPLPDNDQRGYYSISRRHEDAAVAVFGQNRVTERLPVTRSAYREASADATFRVYEGVGHTVTEEMVTDVEAFHREAAASADTAARTPGTLTTPSATSTATPPPADDGTTATTPGEGSAAGTDPATGTPAETTGASGPGFGVGAALGGVVGAGSLLCRRLLGDESRDR